MRFPQQFDSGRMTKTKKPKSKNVWAVAKKTCRLNQEEISMAKALGLNPKKLIANHASCRQEPWKDPVKRWIRDLYEKCFGKD